MFTQKIKLIAISLITSSALLVQAMPKEGVRPEGRGMGRGEVVMAGLFQAKTHLNLSSSQEALWNDAVTASKAARELAKQQHEQMRALVEREKAKEVMDLTALVGAREVARDKVDEARDAARDKWLAVYNALTLEQKRVASQRIKAMLERMGRRHAKP